MLDIMVLHKDFPDCIVCEVKNTNIILIATYIPPQNSIYYSDHSYDNLKLLLEYYSPSRSVYIMGDLNSRCGDLDCPNIQYAVNPDNFINQNGRKLRSLLAEFPNILLLNGLVHQNRRFDSEFSFFRGDTASQIDVCLTNNISCTDEFRILKKTPHSDHCPVIVTLHTPTSSPVEYLHSCADGFLSYHHYNVNLKLKNPSVSNAVI